MALSIRRLGVGDGSTLEFLARLDADFDLDGRGGPLAPLAPDAARGFLANPAVLFWVAVEGGEVVGLLYCLSVPLRSGPGQELLLYEIGVQNSARRQGVGRALLTEMENWMAANDVREVWVLADNATAVEFYRSCGFGVEGEQPVYMTKEVG